jgi:hypothetical protein
MKPIKCITFDPEAQDALPEEVKVRMKADRKKAMAESNKNRIEIGKYSITYNRKNIPRFVQRLTYRAMHIIAGGDNLEKVDQVLRSHLNEIEYHGSIYISYRRVSEWNDRESLYIRNSSGDYTLVSITPVKEDQE